YAVAFYAATEVILKRLLWTNEEMPLRARLGVSAGLHGSVRWAKELTGRYNHVARATTFRGALSEMRDFRHDVTRREQLEADRLAALEMFSGQAGVDETGAQLDRREFDGTKRALQFIHTAQALRYELSSPGFHRGSFSWFPKQPRVLSRTGCSIPNEPRWAGGTRSLNAVGSGCTRPPTSTSPPSLQSTPTMSSGQSAPPYRPSSEPQPWRYR